jgi:hypothetical protein
MMIDIAKAVPIETEVAKRGGLGLKRLGAEFIGPCPQCAGHDRFSINIKKQVFNCRGCGRSGDIIAFVQHLDAVSFVEAVALLGGGDERKPIRPAPKAVVPQDDDAANLKRALRLWDDASPIEGVPIAEAYLERRGLEPAGDDVMRYLGACPFGDTRYPCILSLYRGVISNEPRAIQRTTLGPRGIKIGRLSLGPVMGAAIKIDHDEDVEYGLVIGEGLETCLAGRQLGFKPCWAVGSAGAIKTFPLLNVQSLTLLVDHDAPDKNGREAGQQAALECSQRWSAAGREVRRIMPRRIGKDMADLIAEAPA